MYFNRSFLRNPQQLNLECLHGTCGNAGLRELAISHFSRDIHFPPVAHPHLLYGDKPSFCQVAEVYCQRCSSTTAVEILSVDGPSRVVCGNDAVGQGIPAVFPPIRQHLIIYTSWKCLHAFLLHFRFYPSFVELGSSSLTTRYRLSKLISALAARSVYLCIFSFVHDGYR